MDEKGNTPTVVDLIAHIRLRPAMYIERLGDGSESNSGIYALLKEAIDRSVDEYSCGFGKKIEINVSSDGKKVSVRDYGRGVSAESAVQLATFDKYFGGMFQPSKPKFSCEGSVGLVEVNALSKDFMITSVSGGKTYWAHFSEGRLLDEGCGETSEGDGIKVEFVPDETIFEGYEFRTCFLRNMVRRYAQLNAGLELVLNGESFVSENGLLDRITEIVGEKAIYPPAHIKNEFVEIAFTHTKAHLSCIESYVNGFRTYNGGTHAKALEAAIENILGLRYFVGIINIKIENPHFVESSKRTLCNRYLWEETILDGQPTAKVTKHGPTLNAYVKKTILQGLKPYESMISEVKPLVGHCQNL